MADKSYRVTALLVIVNCEDGLARTVQHGGAVPVNAKADHIEHLLGFGLIEEGEPLGGLDPAKNAAPKSSEDEPASEADDPDGDGPIPAKSASKDAWLAYAVSQGANPAEIEALTRDQLVAQFGPS